MRRPSSLAVAGYVALFALGAAGGLALGLPALVERAGSAALARLEDRLQVAISAESIAWTYGGELTVEGLRVVDRWAPPGEPPLLTAGRLRVSADLSLTRPRVRLRHVALEDATLHVVARSNHSYNLAHLVEGLRGLVATEGGAGTSLAAGDEAPQIARSLPTVTWRRASVAIDAPLPALPLGLEVPDRFSLSGGELELKASGHGAAAALSLSGDFSETSLDPGFGLGVEVTVGLDGHPEVLGIRFDRPVRFYLGRRVAGVRGVRWTPAGVELGQLQLSVPLEPDKRYRTVGAAVTIERLSLAPEPRALLARLGGALPTKDGLGAWLREAVGALDRVEVGAPAVVMRVNGAGRHSFEDLLGPLRPSAGPGPEGVPGEAAGGALIALLTDASLTASERLLGDGPRPRAGRSLRQRVTSALGATDARVDHLARAVAGALQRLPFKDLVVTEGRLDLLAADTRVEIARLDLEARRDAERVIVEAEIVAPEVTRRPTTLTARLDRRTADVELDVAVAGLPLALPAGLGVLPLVAAGDDGRGGGVLHDSRLSLSWRGGGARARIEGFLQLADADLRVPALAKEPLKGVGLRVDFDLLRARDEGRLTLRGGRVRLGDLEVDLDAELEGYLRKPRLSLHARLDETPVQELVDALPRAMMSRLDGLTVGGTLAWELRVEADSVDLAGLTIDSRPVLRGFVVRSLGHRVDFDALRRSFSYPIRRADGSPGSRYCGPLTADWVPLDEITPYLPKAVTTTEDGRFYRHSGISTAALRESLIANLTQGRFVRGGSTITQQLVKNLFLGPDKTIARKLQELFIAWQLERALTKDEIMALYLNIIELGPGIYGVGAAADHWFGKSPAELTALDAIFLASIIPNPRRYHRFFEQGHVSPAWRNTLRVLLGIMVERGKISAEEAAAQAPYDPIFRGQTAAPDAAPDQRPSGPDGTP